MCKVPGTPCRKILKLNEHPLEHLRVNVVAAQFPEFQETYGIQPGDGMYVASEDRIAIWGMPDNTTE